MNQHQSPEHLNKSHTSEHPAVETPVEARQGDRRELNKRVLVMSTVGAILALGLIVLIFA